MFKPVLLFGTFWKATSVAGGLGTGGTTTFSSSTTGGLINLGLNPPGKLGADILTGFNVGASPISGITGFTLIAGTAATFILPKAAIALGGVTSILGLPGLGGNDNDNVAGVLIVIVPTFIVGTATLGNVILLGFTVFSVIVFSGTDFGVIFAPKSILSTNSIGFLTIPYIPKYLPFAYCP